MGKEPRFPSAGFGRAPGPERAATSPPAGVNGALQAMANKPSAVKQAPAAPPVYRPRPAPALLQAKPAPSNRVPAPPRSAPIVPPVFRPPFGPPALQAKMPAVAPLNGRFWTPPRTAGLAPGARPPHGPAMPRPAPPPVFRLPTGGPVGQAKMAGSRQAGWPAAASPADSLRGRTAGPSPAQSLAAWPGNARVPALKASPAAAPAWPRMPPPPGRAPLGTTFAIQRAARKKAVWDPEGSDSESDIDDTVDEALSSRVINRTKKIAKRTKNSMSYTLRTKNKKRVVARINNRTASVAGLAADAKAIHDTIPQFDDDGNVSRSFGATTVVCALYTKTVDGSIRKYCYTNKDNTTPTDLREAAEQLGYHMVNAPKAHAEAEMIMHHHTRYGMTLDAIGCDKDHCAECTKLMDTYYETRVVSDNLYSKSIFKKYHFPLLLQSALGRDDDTRPSQWKERKKLHQKLKLKKKQKKK